MTPSKNTIYFKPFPPTRAKAHPQLVDLAASALAVAIRSPPTETLSVKTAYVTGATGLVGLNLVKRLSGDGWRVRALHRESSNLEFLSRFDAERVVGDVTDRESLETTMPEAVDVVFHVAASVNFWTPKNDTQTKINVEGTRNVVETALGKEAKRFVHVSSIVAYGPQDGDTITEESERRAGSHWVNYFRTKFLSEQEVYAGIDKGLHAVFIAPGNILGPYDLSNWSRMFKLLKEGQLPGVFPGSAAWCHVESVVDAMIRAAEVGAPGERFNIGSVHASYQEVIAGIGARIDVDPPRVLPAWLLKPAARLIDWGSRLTRKEPDVTPEIAHVACMNVEYDCTKAERELGYDEVTLGKMLEDTHQWLLTEGRI